MSDIKTSEARSRNMSKVRATNTGIEVKIRKYLFSKGFRYRKNDKKLPGKPDIVLPKYRTVIFINGCFWHRHPYCKKNTIPKTRSEFWEKKLNSNVNNDKQHQRMLEEAGWHVIVLWECEIKKDFEIVMQKTINELYENLIEEMEKKEKTYGKV